MTSNLYLDLHVLQTVPPSNINRDDAGTPKHALYGGARRARVSSQAWKRAARTTYAAAVPEADRATRTKRIAAMLAERLEDQEQLAPEAAARLATGLLEPLGITMSQRKSTETSYLLFFGHRQLDAIANLLRGRAQELLALEDKALKEELAGLDIDAELMRAHPAEVALFGRMVADRAGLNVDAAVQVAHALSTHAVETEFDYYTAVDDQNEREETGAGMIGTIEFNSATLYRYSTLSLPQLRDNLGGGASAAEPAAQATRSFTEAFVKSMPTGHQNSFAHRTLPFVVVAALRTDQPVNLVAAFERPVFGSRGLADESALALAAEAKTVSEVWGSVPDKLYACYSPHSEGTGEKLTDVFGASISFPQLTDQVEKAVLAGLRENAA
ncbi:MULTISPECIES: type I-E CRISPR-associated protein Cas7/Cse4/CasC [unclassified Streptomyces]|uniref:type I-E CRISPR-associated protein Cas7/Cse4/CasC n=1 Tax=unclassified Streptomyces TaxID=2593676 RepID=UPI002DDA6785|nr:MULTISPECIES: type I-E CRISPR-associated protein Cas7/Cse4/CasC [unclassified Streptomyces]WSA94711.1 type I-E CRISPR-associated protein Cas7/Cse4/CasC [Streptomyces sp. NBC_01795]WSB79131.1 type I-E CRISPR-associated protein Cas7/Cse4/CasC [Streptomyces sp. NBC_01775]WSS12667.1 type I-E CRISPR-associated protein Cas7/Cse4/CasC [Streptomyces sp. NBC_01186]WSS41451.1 type I-E CRISPR-associated protein Cas7/Cse4/CasC [Streptomyces sp. NBC_01187]